MHEKLVITEMEGVGRVAKLLHRLRPERLLPSTWRKCRGCHRRGNNCICWRYNRRDGVTEQHLAAFGEFVITLSGKTASLRHNPHHHQGESSPPPPPPHQHHQHQQRQQQLSLSTSTTVPNPVSNTTTTLTNTHPSPSSLTTTTNTTLTVSTTATSISNTLPTSTTARLSPTTTRRLGDLHNHNHNHRSAGGGVRRPSAGFSTWANHHNHNHQPQQQQQRPKGTLPLTTITTKATMPITGSPPGFTNNTTTISPPPHSSSHLPPPLLFSSAAVTTSTTTTTTTHHHLLDPNNSYNTASSSTSSSLTSSSLCSSSSSRGPALPGPDGDGSEGDNYQSGSEDESGCSPCLISVEERLIKSYPIWYLPDLQRSGAVHLLQGKDEGNFIVRQSSKPDTLALSVRLPPDKGPYIQHYLIEIHDQGSSYSLEASDNKFENLPTLITYYSQCCDELPVQLRLPRAIQDARSRHDLSSLSLLGQEFWGTVMASPTAGSPPTPLEQPRSPVPTPSPRPHDLAFSSFGKGGVTRGVSSSSLLSPQTLGGLCGLGGSLASSIGGSTSSLAPVRPAPPVPTPGDRSVLNLNLAPLDEILKEQPTFSSFRSQPATPIAQLKPCTPVTRPTPPPRASPPVTQWLTQVSPSGSQRLPGKPTPPSRFSPPITGEASTPVSSENGDSFPRHTQAPAPPPRWARSCLTSSPSNITVTTTLTLNVNQVKSLPLLAEDPGVTLHVSNLEISPASTSTTSGPQGSLVTAVPLMEHNGGQAEGQSGILNGYRDCLHLHIKQQITSPQSTPCTPCAPSTPVGEDGVPRVRMRNGRKDKRRLSNHYHEANIVDGNGPYCRSSLADKISDYEDLWSSPPRDMPSTPSPSQVKMSTFKPSSEMSKSMGDLSEIAKSTKPVHFTYDTEAKDDQAGNVCTVDLLNGNGTDATNTNLKSTSPFYMEPADALREHQPQARINKASNKLAKKVTNRYSDSNIQWKTRQNGSCLGKIDSSEDLLLALSTENLAPTKNKISLNLSQEDVRNKNFENEKNKLNAGHLMNGQGRSDVRRHSHVHSRLGGRGKPIAPPRLASDTPNGNMGVETGQESDGGLLVEHRFPMVDGGEADSVNIPGDRTVQDLISEKLPDLTLDAQSLAPSHTTRVSEYDNVGMGIGRRDDLRQQQQQHPSSRRITPPEERLHPPLPTHYFPSTVSESGTEFSEPWDSRRWESIMHFEDDSSVDHYPRSLTVTPALRHILHDDSDAGCAAITDTDSFVHVAGEVAGSASDDDAISVTPTLSLAQTTNLDTQQRSRIMSPQLLALRHRQDAENGVAIRTYATDLGRDTSTTFCRAIANFLTCTLESPERDPAVVTRNVRQFMSGMKNYLVTSGEREFETIVKQQQGTLKATEFLNLDAILEDVLVRLVLRPLWTHINKLFVDAYTASGAIQLLATNMKYARTQPTRRLGVRAELWPPRGSNLATIRSLLARMQRVYAPREKLESLLATVSHIYQAMYEGGTGGVQGEAEDLVPMIMWVLSQAGVVSAEVEANYMWGLLLPSASDGEASYYLEAFHSAIHALKNFTPSPDSSPGNSLDSVRQECALVTDHGTVKIVIPDEQNGSIVTRTLPIRPATTTREVCRMMAHKLKVTNPQDYALYKLVDGLESLLTDNECPHKVKSDLTSHGFHCTFAFKRMDAKIAWPILS